MAVTPVAGGSLVTFGMGYQSGLAGLGINTTKWTNTTTFSAQYYGNFLTAGLPWLRIRDDGTNRICSVSLDGINFTQVHSIGRTDFITPDNIGWFCNPNNNATPNQNPSISMLSWLQTS